MLNVSKICIPLNSHDTKITEKKAINELNIDRKGKQNVLCTNFLLRGTNNLLSFFKKNYFKNGTMVLQENT